MGKALVLGGATGLLGRPLVKVLEANGWETATLGREDGDLLDPDFLRARIESSQPDAVFNTVAWTQVDAAEDSPDAAMAVNRGLPNSLGRILQNMPGTWLGHISTDFVFSGYHSEPFTEESAPNPATVYGKTKQAGEEAVLSLLPERGCVIRTAWLFGPGRRNFVDTIIGACRKRDTVSVVDDQLGSPTYTLDAAAWCAALAEKKANGIWHAVNSGQASWCELATEAINLLSCPCRVTPIPSQEWPQKAKRPHNSSLDNSKLSRFLGRKPRCWAQALRDYLFNEYEYRRAEESE